MEGGCTCRHVRYRLIGAPMIVHACYCRWCQRETGTARALNAAIRPSVLSTQEPEIVDCAVRQRQGAEDRAVSNVQVASGRRRASPSKHR